MQRNLQIAQFPTLIALALHHWIRYISKHSSSYSSSWLWTVKPELSGELHRNVHVWRCSSSMLLWMCCLHNLRTGYLSELDTVNRLPNGEHSLGYMWWCGSSVYNCHSYVHNLLLLQQMPGCVCWNCVNVTGDLLLISKVAIPSSRPNKHRESVIPTVCNTVSVVKYNRIIIQ